jgi:predicted GNAT family N-acyltransferase
MASSNITVLPAQPSDFLTLARVEAAACANSNLSLVAFGPASQEGHSHRAGSLAKPRVPGEVVKIVKALMAGVDGKEKIVGWAGWSKFTAGEAVATEKGEEEDEEKHFAGTACPRLCVDVLVRGQDFMKESCGEKDYVGEFCYFLIAGFEVRCVERRSLTKLVELGVLVTSPEFQRRGVGIKLLEDGLAEADAAGLQAVVSASPAGEPLYKKLGFVEYKVFSVDLSEYKGGGGRGLNALSF